MPTQSFSSFEAFFDANRHANLRPMLLGRDCGNWALTNLIVNKLGIQWGQAGGKAVVEGASRPGGLTIFFQTQGDSAFSGNGRRLDALSLMIAGPGDEFCLAADSSSRRWCSLYVPNALLNANEAAPSPAISMRGVYRLPPDRIDRFRFIVGQLDEAVQRGQADFVPTAAQTAAEHKLVQEIRNVLAVPDDLESTPGRQVVSRSQIIRMSLDFVEQSDGEHLSVQQLAGVASVSERTLRDAFQRYFGVAPVQYLNRRTLHQVRKALKSADPSVTTVTRIATQFGVWELGRFARDYCFLFGELPSQTLRRLH
jgi:AraC family transcriptional regulator, ethanolamine operon transcriptional activator